MAERAYARTGVVDMDALEQGMRAAAMKDGAAALSSLLSKIGDPAPGTVACPDCAARMESLGRRRKDLTTLLGTTPLERPYYACRQPGCEGHAFPKDALLDVAETGFSPGVRRLMARSGARDSFAKGEEDLWVYSGIRVREKDVERIAEAVGADIECRAQATRKEICAGRAEPPPPEEAIPILYVGGDGTGVPVTKRETAGRKGKQPDGTAKTREAKVGCVFTQVGTDEKGRPVREEGSTTYTGAIETAEVFGERLYAEAVARGLLHADLVVVLGDGAPWIWNLAELHFPGAIHIVDLYHAREHLYALLRLLFPDDAVRDACRTEWLGWLEDGKIERLVDAATNILPLAENARNLATNETDYFSTNAKRMRYADFRARKLFVGSGVVEAGCKTVVASRMKKSGAKWSVRGANAIIALRCALLSQRFDDYWALRSAA
jgi:hypothetical protein